ncbi:hypothetical protein Hanom_Chr06g00538881 [Helianthus anomalus]
MSFFRYADVLSDDMEIDPATADEKFVLEWDVQINDSVMDDLIARTFLFNISTPLDHARSQKMKNQDLGAAVLSNQAQSNVYVTELYRRWVEAESVRENLEKETPSLKRKIQRTPDAEKKLSQLSQDLQTQREKVKSLTTQNQSSQADATSAAEERDKISSELQSFAESFRKKDEEHKEVLAKMEESVSNARSTYEKTMAGDKNVVFIWGAQLLAKNVHRGPEMTVVVAAVNNAMSSIGVNSGLQQGYVHVLKKKTPYSKVPLLNRNAKADLKTAVDSYESLTFPVMNDLPKLINAPLPKIKEALFLVGGESSRE